MFTKCYVRLQNRFEEDRGAAMAEYGLLLALVALAAIGILVTFGESLERVFSEADEKLNENLDGGDGGDAGGDA